MRCATHNGVCLLRNTKVCERQGYCKEFDFDGTPMCEAKLARNLERQRQLERRGPDVA